VEVRGHYVLKQDAIASARGAQREPATEGPGSDDGDGDHELLKTRSLLNGEGRGNILGTRAGAEQMLGNFGALVSGERWDSGEHAAQRDCDVVNVVHQADGFSR